MKITDSLFVAISRKSGEIIDYTKCSLFSEPPHLFIDGKLEDLSKMIDWHFTDTDKKDIKIVEAILVEIASG